MTLRTTCALAVACGLLAGCDASPSEEDLDRWLAEAREADRRAAEAHEQVSAPEWTLEVSGQVARPSTLDWAQLEALATDEIETRSPDHNHPDPRRYRGVRVSRLLEEAGVEPDVTEVTFLAFDGFRATVQREHLERYPILLAMEQDGEAIERELGGPIYLVFPQDEHPALEELYEAGSWVFYVTEVIAGTEPISLTVNPGGRVFSEAELRALEPTSVEAVVGYRIGWPSEPVSIHGVSLAAILEASEVSLDRASHVRVFGSAPITHDEGRPTRFTMEEVRSGHVLIALSHGAERASIPARLGGPLAVAFGPAVAEHHRESDWITFVDAIEVESP